MTRRTHPATTAKASQSVALGSGDPRQRRNAQALSTDVDASQRRRDVARRLDGLTPLPMAANLGQTIVRLNEILAYLKEGV